MYGCYVEVVFNFVAKAILFLCFFLFWYIMCMCVLECLHLVLEILKLLGWGKGYCPVYIPVYSTYSLLIMVCFIPTGKAYVKVINNFRKNSSLVLMWLPSFPDVLHLSWVTLSLDLMIVMILIAEVTKIESCDQRVSMETIKFIYIIDCIVQFSSYYYCFRWFFFSKWFFLHWKFQKSIKCVIQPVYWFIDPVCYFNDILELEVIYPDLKIYNCLIPNRWQSAVVAPNNRISNLLFGEKVPRLLNSNIIMSGVTAPQKLWLRAYTICGGHSIAQEICNY